MKSLFFDTETTGKADFRAAPNAEHQPRLVQIGAILQDDETGRIFGELNLLVKPNGKFTIPEDATKVHGISTDMAESLGVPLLHALEAFCSMAKAAQQYVCHNADFDLIVTQGECLRMVVPWVKHQAFCTMQTSTPICQLPNPMFPGRFKWPRLEEVYQFAFKKPLELAHDAMADVRACRDVYYWLQKQQEAA